MATETDSIVLTSKNGQHRYTIYVRDDGRLAVARQERDRSGQWSSSQHGQGEKVLAQPHGTATL